MIPAHDPASNLSDFEEMLRALAGDARDMAWRDAKGRLQGAMLDLAQADIDQRLPLSGVQSAYDADAPNDLHDGRPSGGHMLDALQQALAETRRVEDVQRLRRAFARRHHPDLHSCGAEMATTELMQAANALIDARLVRLRTGEA